MRRIVSAAAAVCVVLVLGSCGQEDEPGPTAAGSGGGTSAGAEDISFGAALAQIRGHHLVSLELFEAGDEKGARVHADHPVTEILHSVVHELAERDEDAAEELEASLEAGADAVSDAKTAEEVAAAFDRATQATEDALTAVVGDNADAASYEGSVIAALLGTAAHEYEEAVDADSGKLRLLVEYQDGYAFVLESARMYEEIASDVEAASTEEAEEIEEAFETLRKAFPSPEPPSRLLDVLDVEAAADLIAHELEETVGAEPVEESDPEEIVAEIEELLTEIEEAYRAGDPEEAAELSAEAYLENYEVIEAGVIELAPDVNEELEPLLGAELRRQIQAGASQEEIETMIARARELLHEALAALEGEH